MKSKYTTPLTAIVAIDCKTAMLTASDGMPEESGDNLIYTEPAGAFGGDESVAARRDGLWDGDE